MKESTNKVSIFAKALLVKLSLWFRENILRNADFSLPLKFVFIKTDQKRGRIEYELGSRRSLQTWTITLLLCIGVISPVLWFVSSGYRKLIPSILGVTEVAYELPSQRTFASGYDDVNSVNVSVTDTEVKMSPIEGWWNGDYAGRKKLEIKNLSGETDGSQFAGSTVSLTINTKELYDLGYLQNDCDDLRIIYSTDGVTFTEKERSYQKLSTSTNCSDSVATQVSFPLQADIANAATDGNYYLYYGNGSATSPSYGDNGFDIKRADLSTVNATLVCPFNGSTTCLDGETPSTATGAIRFDQNNVGSAMSFDGVDDYVDTSYDKSNYNNESDFTWSMWFYATGSQDRWEYLLGFGDSFSIGRHLSSSPDKLYIVYRDDSGVYHSQTMQDFPISQWVHISLVRSGSNLIFYLNGNYSQTITITGGINAAYPSLQVSPQRLFRGIIDELAIYNRALTADEISALYNSGNPAPITPDSSTVLLYHFDENGNDPRNTGKVIDSSGNGNHGTINGGAKYTAGKVPASSYASHQGVFIEEGTTNLVDNPSFENNITDFWSGKSAVTAYTSGATDADGNAYLGNNNVNDVYFYDTANDSDAATQVTLGVDPNWRKGVVLKTGTLSTTNNGSLIEVTGTNANGKGIEITVTSTTTFTWKEDGGADSASTAMSKGNWVQLETGDNDIWVRFSSTGTFTTNDVFRINSWVIEPFSATRGYRRDFPEQSYLVATDSTLDIIDAVEDKLWMRFIQSGSLKMIAAFGGTMPNSTFSLNGMLYLGTKAPIPTTFGYLHNVDLVNDYGKHTCSSTDGGQRLFKGNVATRNQDLDATIINVYHLVDRRVNDVHAVVINSKQYVAVATDGGVSVINETDGSVAHFYDSDWNAPRTHYVWLTSGGELYFTSGSYAVTYTDARYLLRIDDINTKSTNTDLFGTYSGIYNATYENGVRYDPDKFPDIDAIYSAVYPSYSTYRGELYLNNFPILDIFVTEGTSSVDNSSNSIYVAGTRSLTIANEKQGDESNGSVKYYTKDEITEELIGDIRGAWGFNTNATLANGDTVADVSVRGADMTAVADAGGIGVMNGVRGKAFQFDGTNDYLTQKVYEDQTGASWGPANHGLSLANGQAFARVQGVTLAPFAEAANPYMLVVKDPEGDVAWGYIDTAGGGETLGNELVIDGTFDSWTDNELNNWVEAVSVDADPETISPYGGTGTSVKLVLSGNNQSLSQNLSVSAGKLYKITFAYKGNYVKYHVKDLTNNVFIKSWTENNPSNSIDWSLYSAYFTVPSTCTSISIGVWGTYLGDTVYFDNVSVKEVTDTATDGVKIMSTKGGSTQSWAGISASFNYNASSYTFEVRKTDFQITGDLTVGAWVKNNQSNTVEKGVISRGTGGTGPFILFGGTGSNSAYLRIHTVGGRADSPKTFLPVNEWAYLVGTYDGNTVRLYLNGTEQGTGTIKASAILDLNDNLLIGAYGVGSDKISGTIDEPFITAEALTADQIKNMFDQGCRAMGGTPGTGTCTGINEASTTNYIGGSTNITNAVSVNSAGTRALIGTDGATGAISLLDLTGDKIIKSFTTATTPALVNNDTTALAVVRWDDTNPQFIAGSETAGVSVINNDLTVETQNTSTAYSRFGTDSLKIDNSVSATNTLYKFTKTLTAASYTFSFYAYTDGNQVTSADLVPYLNSGEILTNVTYEDAGGGFTRVYGTFRGFASANIFGVKVKAGKTVYIDGIQLEAKAYATTYADGSLGTGYSWSGTENNSNSVRTNSDLSYLNSLNIDSQKGSMSFWYKPDFSAANPKADYNAVPIITVQNTDGQVLLHVSFRGANFVFQRYSQEGYKHTSSAVQTFDKNDWLHLVINWGPGNQTLYVSNASFLGYPSETWTVSDISNKNIMIGTSHYFGSTRAKAAISDFRIYDQPLTPAEVSDIYYQGLQSHGITETKGRFDGITDASYYSGRIDLNAVSAWSETDDLTIASALNGGTINYYTCTKNLITGVCAEEDFLPIVGNEIQSDPARYMFVKGVFNSADSYTTPTLTGITFNYAPDNDAPTNPTEIHAYSTSTKETEYNEVDYANSNRPYFEWPQAEEVGGASDTGEGSSGVNGYYVYFGEDDTATPQTAGTYQIESEEGNNHYQLPVDDALTTKGNYYLRIQSMDNAGSIQSTVWEAYTYQYDNEEPNNPSGVSVTPAGWSKVNSYEFYWPTGADDDSQLWGYCYKTGDPEVEEVCIEDNSVQNIQAYQAGENIFYLRSMDNAGNKNTNFIQTTYYYNADAPSSPNNLDVTPDTSDENEFTFTWDAPSDFNGEIKGYYYSINTEPTIDNSIFTTETQVGPGPYATRQGENKFYVLAEDTAGNKNFDIYSEVSFYANTTAPGIPTNLTVNDSSDRNTNTYSLTLNWKAPTDTTPDHYNIYRSSDNETFTAISTTTSLGLLDLGLSTDLTYYYYITAEDSAGAESGHSQTVSKKPSGKFTTPPTITVNPTATAGRTSSVITWETDRESNSFVQIGTQDVYTRTQGQWITSKQHSVELKGLNPATVYHYRVQSIDDPELIDYDSNEAFSQDYTFTTGEIPKIKDLEVKEVRHSSAIVTWGTDVTSTSVVYLTGGEERTIEDQSSGGTTTHTILVDNLSAGTSYNVRVSGTDEEGNTLIGEEHSFTTPAYPKVSEVRLEQQKEEAEGTVKVTWITNVPTTSVVKYNKKGETETVETSNSELVTEHEMIASGLQDNSEYEILVEGRDGYGNLAQSEVNTFLTDVDTRPPKIENVLIETGLIGSGTKAKAQIIVSWETDELSSSQVEYDIGIGETDGTVTYAQKTKEDNGLVNKHVVVISELSPSQVYRVRLLSKDKSGNETYSDNNIVVTDEATENALELVMNSLLETFGWLFGE